MSVADKEMSVSGVSACKADDNDTESLSTEQSSAEDEPVVVEVPKIDDNALSSFFISSASASQQDREEASIDTFNDIFMDSNDMYDFIVVTHGFPLTCLSGGHSRSWRRIFGKLLVQDVTGHVTFLSSTDSVKLPKG